jgi:hypothetical protein
MSAPGHGSLKFGRILPGMIFASAANMVLKEATMPCPNCQGDTPAPLSGSTFVIAWYRCNMCGHFWSAHIRNGEPVTDEGATTLQSGRREPVRHG